MAQRIVRRRKSPDKMMILVSLFLILICTGILIFLFVRFLAEDGKNTNAEKLKNFEVFYHMKDTLHSESLVHEAQLALAARTLTTSDPDDGKDIVTEYVRVDGLVPETLPVDDDYFNDAIFIGDSISLGMKNSGVLPAKNMLAAQNVGIISVLGDNPVYYVGSKKLSLQAAIQEQLGMAPKKIYILLGLNGLPGASNDSQITQYNKLIDQLQKAYPGAIIYVQSLTPMTKNSEYQKKFTVEKINDMNDKLLVMAKEQGVYYLNVQEVLKDKDGYLISDYAYNDGLHMLSNGHKVMVKYYKNHTVDEDGYAYKVVKEGE